MEFKTITYEVKDNGIAIIKLNRPSNYNAINKDVAEELAAALKASESDNQVRVLVITGSGEAFCAGGDLAWLMAADDNLKKREILDRASEIATILYNFGKPVIAAVNGVAAGAGTALVLACDIIIASDKAKFAPNFINIASVPDTGLTWFLTRRAGHHKAAELLLTGQAIDAREAQRLNIFNRVVEADKLDGETFALAELLAAKPRRASRYIKQMLRMSVDNDLASQLEVEASLQLMAWSDPDFAEGVKAFLEKRKPRFA